MFASHRYWIFAALFILSLLDRPERAAATDAYGDPLPPRAKVRIGTTRFRHGDAITAAAFTPDGRSVASASRDGTLSLWEAESGRERARFQGHAGAVLAVAFSRGGDRMISGAADGTVRFWRVPRPPWTDDLLPGQETRCFRLGRESVQAVALSADGSTAAAGTADGELIVWDLNADKELHRFTQEGQVYCLALSADGKQLAANQAASGAAIWNTVEGRPCHHLKAGVIASLAFSPDGLSLAAGYQDPRLVLWDTRDGTVIRSLSEAEPPSLGELYSVLSVCYSADGRRLASGGSDHVARIWDVESGRQISTAKGHGDGVTAVAFDADGKRLVSGGADNIVRLSDASTARSLVSQREPSMPVTGVSLSPDARMLAVITFPEQLGLWDTTSGGERSLPAALTHCDTSAAAFRPLGSLLAVAGADGRLRFCDLAARTVRTIERESPRRLERLVWSRDGKSLASHGPDHHIDLWGPIKAELLHHMGLQQEAYLALAFDRQGDYLAATSETDAIRLWKRATGEEKAPIEDCFAGALALSFSADGRSLFAVNADGRVGLWELATRQMRHSFPQQAKPITAATFTPDGRFLATGGADGAVHLWDTDLGKVRRVLHGHRGPITMLDFAAQAPMMASASRDTTTIVWDLTDLLHTEAPPTLELSDRQLQVLYRKLAGAAPEAYDAIQTLRRAPRQIVPYLLGRMRPVKVDWVQLIADLDNDEFRVREKASQQLARHGRIVEKSLRQALENKPSPEVRRRILDLLRQLRDDSDVSRITPFEVRCIELLERIDSPEARRLLQILADGIPEAELTQEANASLFRLAHRVVGPHDG